MIDAGWFADPSGKIDTFRWWDGQAWTRWLSADPTAPDPGAVPALEPPKAASPDPDTPPSDQSPAYAPPHPDQADAGDEPATRFAPPDPADRVVGLPAAAAILVGGVLLAIIAVGAIISLTANRPLTGPAVAPAAPSAVPRTVLVDPATRTVSVEELTAVLPSAPFSCDARARAVTGLFTSALSCSVAVHTDYDDEKNDWSAATGVGVLDQPARPVADLRELTAQTASGLISRNYTVEDITITKAENRPFTDVAPDGKARLVTAELHVSYPELPSAYDQISVAVVELRSGEHVAWWAFEPDDSPEEVAEALRSSAKTVTARK